MSQERERDQKPTGNDDIARGNVGTGDQGPGDVGPDDKVTSETGKLPRGRTAPPTQPPGRRE